MRALLAKIQAILKDKRTRRFWTRIISVMAGVVVFISTYALILPAITMEREAACGIEAHQHSEECYEEVLICGLEESEDHQHTEACYESVLICEKEEHIHSEQCYKEEYSGIVVTDEVSRSSVSADQDGPQNDLSDQADIPSNSVDVDIREGQETAGSGDASSASDSSNTTATSSLTVGDNAADGMTDVLPADLAEEDLEALADGYVPPLDPLDFNNLLTKETGFYYYHVEEGQSAPADTSAVTGWKKLNKDTILGSTDLVRAYLAYSIPAGALNETNQVARYRLPSNIHLTDDQILAINGTENGIALTYADGSDNADGTSVGDQVEDKENQDQTAAVPNHDQDQDQMAAVADQDRMMPETENLYQKYLGAEAVEGTRTPDKALREGAQEYISAVVKAENIYENTLDENGNYVAPTGHITSDRGECIGQDLIFIFTPYTIQKNQNTYDSDGNPVRAGVKVTGWFTVDFNMEQIDWTEAEAEAGAEALTSEAGAVTSDNTGTDDATDSADGSDYADTKSSADATDSADTGTNSSFAVKSAKVVFAQKDAAAGIKERSETLRMMDQEPVRKKDEKADFKDGTLTADGDGYHITLDYTSEAQIPGTAALFVKEITPDTDPKTYAACLEQAAEKMGSAGSAGTPTLDTAASRFFDIEIVVTDEAGNTEKIEPKAPVAVNIRLSSTRKEAGTAKEIGTAKEAGIAADNEINASGQTSSVDGDSTDSKDSAQNSDPTVLHFAEDGVEEIVSTVDASSVSGNSDADQAPDQVAEQVEGATAISFEAESFSIYGVVYTVDFHYEINGKVYECSIPGGGFISLANIVEVLGIADADSDTYGTSSRQNSVQVSQAAKKFVADVEKVEFSSPELVWVGKTDVETTVGQLKDANGLDVQYSADMTEDRIEEINAQTVEAGDWALISMQPFLSQERLTVTMKNGDQFVIEVTDIQLPEELESHLLAYYTFDGPYFKDVSGNNAQHEYDDHYTMGSVYTPIKQGMIGNSFYFNGSYSLELHNSSGGSLLGTSTEATISFWAQPTGANNPNWAFYVADRDEPHKDDSHLYYIGLFNKNGTITSERFPDYRQGSVNAAAALNEWHYITVTHSADTMKVYVDGQLAGQQTSLASLQQVIGNNSIFQIGKANWGGGERYVGYIDEFAVYDKALTDEEILALYNETYRTPELSLESHRALKTKVTDLNNHNQVIIYNGVWNEEKNDYDFYAIDGDGNLVEIRDNGDSIYWKGDPSLLWELTVYEEGGSETGYYELRNTATGKYLCPQSDGLFSDTGLGINLNGRRDNRYGSEIEKWDGSQMAYYGYRYDDNQLVTASSNEAAIDRDWEFYFAVPDEPTGDLETVRTVTNPDGLTMKMFDYNVGDVSGHRLSYMTEVLGHKDYIDGGITQGILGNYYNYQADNSFPTAVYDGNNKTASADRDLSKLFAPNWNESVGGEVNNLFIQSIFDETGYYEYSAFDNYAYLNGNNFTVYKQIGTPNDSGSDPVSFYYQRGNFLPYNAIDKYHTSTNTNKFDDNGDALLPSDPRYGETLYKPVDNVDYFFGMSIDAHFEMPRDGIDRKGNPVTYEFNGDDDMWVYIDGVLVLDLGGVHDARGGVINFATGEIIYAFPEENHLPTTIKDCYEAAGHFPDGTAWDPNRVDEYFDGDTFKDYTTHTMNMYYLERGQGASNLHVRFNLPIISRGSFSVEKKLEDANETYANQRFAYQAFLADGNQGTIIIPGNGTTQDITCVYEGTNTPVPFDADGTFYLKPGEKAVFSVGDSSLQYYVRELNVDPSEYTVLINGENARIQGQTVQSSVNTVAGRAYLLFTNKAIHTGNLQVTKIVESAVPVTGNPSFEFYIYLENTDGSLVPYSNGIYYVRKGSTYYVYEDGNLTPAPDQSSPPYYKAGTFGAIGNIPDGFTIEVRDLLPGTHFLVTERLDNLPAGYMFVKKELTAGTYDAATSSATYNGTAADGKIKKDTTADEVVTNRPTGAIAAEKTWNDGGFVTAHGDIYAALYKKTGTGTNVTYSLVEGSVKKLEYDSTSQKYRVEYYLPDNLVSDYVIREVSVTLGQNQTITVDQMITEGGHITVSGETTLGSNGAGSGTDASDTYIVNYEDGTEAEYDLPSGSTAPANAKGRIRTDQITNTLPKVSLYKINEFTGTGKQYLKDAVFSMETSSGQTVKNASDQPITFTSDTNGLLYENRYFSDGTYYFRETTAPNGYTLLENRIVVTVQQGAITAVMENPGTTLYADQLSSDHTAYRFEVMNYPGVELPNTGGPGTRLLYLAGLMLTGLAVAGLVMRKQRSGR